MHQTISSSQNVRDVELARTEGDVLRLLDACVDTARAENSADGYFPLLYSWETRDLIAAADAGGFGSAERLRAMIVAFANQYFTARAQFRAGATAPAAWELAFRASRTESLLVVEHLLLAMNAHINRDLGIAAAETGVVGEDYQRVDAVLARGIDRVQTKLNRLSRVLWAVDILGRQFDELFVAYSLEAARREALVVAERLLRTPEGERPSLILEVGARAAAHGRRILHPPLRARVWLALARLSEPTLSPREIIAELAKS